MSIHKNDQTFITGDNSGMIKVWDLKKEYPLFSMKEHNSAIHSLAFSYDGQYLASGSDDQTVKIWQYQAN